MSSRAVRLRCQGCESDLILPRSAFERLNLVDLTRLIEALGLSGVEFGLKSSHSAECPNCGWQLLATFREEGRDERRA